MIKITYLHALFQKQCDRWMDNKKERRESDEAKVND